MKNTKKSFYVRALSVAALGSILSFGTGCVVHERGTMGGEVVVDSEPPPPIVETIPPTPDPAFVWVGGGWAWGGGGWHWQGGHYERPPHAGAHWVANRYEVHGGRRVWVRGGWR